MRTHLRALGEELDAHRTRQQAAHPKLALTSMYNVLEKLRAGETIEDKDREIYDQGLIGILKDVRDQIDAEVTRAYRAPRSSTRPKGRMSTISLPTPTGPALPRRSARTVSDCQMRKRPALRICALLKENRLAVTTAVIARVLIEANWFEGI